MKYWLLSALALSISLGTLALSWSFRGPKVGYAETTILLAEFGEAQKARLQFEAAQKEWDKNINALNDSLSSGMESMKGRYNQASAAEREEMERELGKRNEELQRYTMAVKRMSEDKERELLAPVLKKMNSYLETWGKENGYALILGTSQGNILQADARYNVTRKLLADMNAHYGDLPDLKAKKPAAAAAQPAQAR